MRRVLLFAILLLAGLAVFVLGSPYYSVWLTNGSQAYYIALTAFFLVISQLLRRSRSLSRFWPAAYSFFIASAALLFLSTGILNLQRAGMGDLQFLALDKLSQFLHVVPVVILLTLLARDDLRSIFIKRGNLKRGFTFGLVSFALFAIAGIAMQPDLRRVLSALPSAIPWLLLFIFANAIMEELWFRAIFLKKFGLLIGRAGAMVVTALVFGASHINATYEFPGGAFVFGLVVFVLGLVGAYAMDKEDGLLGPVLFHAGYDLMIIISVLNSG